MPHPDAVATDFWPYDGSEAYAFLHNCDTDGNQIVEGGGDALPTFEDLRFFNFPFYDAGKSPEEKDRKSVVEGKSVSVRVDLGGRRIIKKKKNITQELNIYVSR